MNEGKDHHPYRSPLMDFTRQEETTFTTPPPLRESAFTRPLPSYSPSLSLLSSRSTTTITTSPTAPPKPLPSPSPPPPPSPPPTATTPSDPSARYRECLRNHAAAAGGHVLDGCGEFMPDTNTPVKCAACSCHRSFHRKDDDGEQTHQSSPFYPPLSHVPLLLPPPRPHRHFSGFLPSPTAIAASGGATTESSSEDRHAGAGALAKKRFRTKFSAEQKRRMMEFATRVGWRIQKENEGEMERVCAEIGVSRQVVKVWMHNNKHAMMIKKCQAPDEQMQQVEKSQIQQQQQQQQQQPQPLLP